MIKPMVVIGLLGMILSGCWNNVELNETRFVGAVGIDMDKEGRYLLTVNVIKPTISGNKASGGASSNQVIIQSTGYTMFDAIRNLIGYSGYKLSYHHLQYLAIGEEVAKKDLIGPLDLFFRDQETFGRYWIIYVEGKAESLLRAKGTTHDLQPLEMDKEMLASDSVGKYPAVELLDLMRMLADKEKVGYLPVSHPIPSKTASHETRAVIIKGGKVVDSLNDAQTRGLLWATDKIKGTIVIVPLEKRGNKASIEVIDSRVKIKPLLQDNGLRIEVTVKPTAYIGALDSPFPVTVDRYRFFQSQINHVVQLEVEEAIRVAQKNKADVFGFSDYVHRAFPQQWKTWEGKWPDVFAKTEITVKAQSHLLLNGLLDDQLREKK